MILNAADAPAVSVPKDLAILIEEKLNLPARDVDNPHWLAEQVSGWLMSFLLDESGTGWESETLAGVLVVLPDSVDPEIRDTVKLEIEHLGGNVAYACWDD